MIGLVRPDGDVNVRTATATGARRMRQVSCFDSCELASVWLRQWLLEETMNRSRLFALHVTAHRICLMETQKGSMATFE